jgi:UDP-N-acetylglucosamine acyltransferase
LEFDCSQPICSSPLIHPTAIIDPRARIAPDVRIGPYVIIVGPVNIGPGCVIGAATHLFGPLTMGSGNIVHSHAVLGDWPQDHKFRDEPSETIIGDDNTIREGVTIHRSTGPGTRTQVGSHCFFMVNSHVGHNCVVSDAVTLVNAAALGGHVHVAPNAIIGGHCGVHQFVRIGRLAMISHASMQSVDIPPFTLACTPNIILQLNAVGLRRAGIPREHISALREMFALLFRRSRVLNNAIRELPAHLLAVPEVQEFITFCEATKRGIARFKHWSARAAAADPAA